MPFTSFTVNLPSPSEHPRDPLHGVTLEKILTELHAQYGWEEMGHWGTGVRVWNWGQGCKNQI